MFFILKLQRDTLGHEKPGLSEPRSLPLSLLGAHSPPFGDGSSNPPPQTLDPCWLTGLDLSFASCPGSESEWGLCLLVKGSWMEIISCSLCSPGECWLCYCLGQKTRSVCWFTWLIHYFRVIYWRHFTNIHNPLLYKCDNSTTYFLFCFTRFLCRDSSNC